MRSTIRSNSAKLPLVCITGAVVCLGFLRSMVKVFSFLVALFCFCVCNASQQSDLSVAVPNEVRMELKNHVHGYLRAHERVECLETCQECCVWGSMIGAYVSCFAGNGEWSAQKTGRALLCPLAGFCCAGILTGAIRCAGNSAEKNYSRPTTVLMQKCGSEAACDALVRDAVERVDADDRAVVTSWLSRCQNAARQIHQKDE